jgi:hypothetical protein
MRGLFLRLGWKFAFAARFFFPRFGADHTLGCKPMARGVAFGAAFLKPQEVRSVGCAGRNQLCPLRT